MTSARRPAGAPNDWEERNPAGTPGDDSEGGADQAAAVEQDFDALVADVKRERDEYLQLAQRARADFENYRKRAAKETQEAERRGKATLAKELVPALDNLERALRSAGIDPETETRRDPAPGADDGEAASAAGEPPSEEVTAHEALARGVALVYGELRSALDRTGVERYDPTGEKFDPLMCEALSTRPAQDGVDSGTVVETIEKGYRLDGQVLRAARVVVSE